MTQNRHIYGLRYESRLCCLKHSFTNLLVDLTAKFKFVQNSCFQLFDTENLVFRWVVFTKKGWTFRIWESFIPLDWIELCYQTINFPNIIYCWFLSNNFLSIWSSKSFYSLKERKRKEINTNFNDFNILKVNCHSPTQLNSTQL